MSSSQIHERLGSDSVSLVTVKRALTLLTKDGMLDRQGKGRSIAYSLSRKGVWVKPFRPESYLEKDPDARKGKKSFSFGIFDAIDFSFFTTEDMKRLDAATGQYVKNSAGTSPTLAKKELERFIVEMSWKSSKIEGNTYTLLDTERLILEGIKSAKNTENETVMILNHKKALEYIVSHKELWEALTLAKVESIHQLLTHDLGIARDLRKMPVGVTGTTYRPLGSEFQIKDALESLIRAIDARKNPFEKALLAILGTSYIQPFEDGNKRTARLLGNALLLANHVAPLSYRSVDEVGYRAACLVFYEQNSIEPFKQLFIEQYLFACANYNLAS